MHSHRWRYCGLLTLVGCVAPSFAANMVIFGASGQFGSEMVREALGRGHHVFGVSRTPEKFSIGSSGKGAFTAVQGDPTELASVVEITKQADAILVALGDREADTPENSAMNRAAIALAKALAAKGKRGPPVVVLGGGDTSAATEAKMLEMLAARGGEHNPRLRQIYLSQWATYQTYKKSNINWTYVATPKNILGVTNSGDASRTGLYRVVTDGSLDSAPDTGLSRADIAAAMVNIAETGKYSQMRVMVAQQQPNH